MRTDIDGTTHPTPDDAATGEGLEHIQSCPQCRKEYSGTDLIGFLDHVAAGQ